MRSIVLEFSEIDTSDRLTVDHYLSDDLTTIKELEKSHYSLFNLGNISSIKGGKRLPINARYSTSGIPYIRVVDIGDYKINIDNAVYIADELHEKIRNYQLRKDDIGIVIVGATIGKTAIFKSSVSPCNFNENMARITTQCQIISPDFLLAYLQSSFGKAYISWLTGGSAQAKLSLERIAKIRVPLPPRSIQDQIAQVMQDAYSDRQQKLDQSEQSYQKIIDYIFEELGISIETMEHKRSALVPISILKGGRFDFEAVVTLQDISSQFIEHETTSLNNVVKQVNERTNPSEENPDQDINYIGLANIQSNTGELANFNPVSGKEILSSSPKFKKGDILYGRMRPYLNKVWIAEFDGICSGETLVFRPNKNKINSRFLHALLLSKITLDQVIPLQSGSSLPRVSAADVLSIKLPIPSDLLKQNKIGDEIEKRCKLASQLRLEAESVVAKAKAKVEKMILGEEINDC
jgi:restriction endonuclease S subunit